MRSARATEWRRNENIFLSQLNFLDQRVKFFMMHSEIEKKIFCQKFFFMVEAYEIKLCGLGRDWMFDDKFLIQLSRIKLNYNIKKDKIYNNLWSMCKKSNLSLHLFWMQPQVPTHLTFKITEWNILIEIFSTLNLWSFS